MSVPLSPPLSPCPCVFGGYTGERRRKKSEKGKKKKWRTQRIACHEVGWSGWGAIAIQPYGSTGESFSPPRASPRHWRRCAHPLPRSLPFSPSRDPIRSHFDPPAVTPYLFQFLLALSLVLSSTLFPIWLLDYRGVSSGGQEPMM